MERVEPDAPHLEAVGGDTRHAVPRPRGSAPKERARETELNAALFFDYLRRGVEPSEQDSRELVNSVRARLRDGVPTAEVLHRYRLDTAALWERVCETAPTAEPAALLDASQALWKFATLILARIAVEAARHGLDPRRSLSERRREIIDALLSGQHPVPALDDPAVPITDAYLVAVTRTDEGADAAATALRRRIEAGPGVFARTDERGWTALLPMDDADGASAVAALRARLPSPPTLPSAATYWVGVGVATARTEIPAAFAEAKVLAELGRCLARDDILCPRADLHFEYTVAVGDAARAGLAAVLAPLRTQPMLTETLEVFVRNGFNQLATARALDVHRNTVTYRLSRVHELTGADPHRPADAMTLTAALLARRLETASFAP
ncbi:PucR family transcriptional regulator [Nocardia bovistercoris]|uniref:Helix-turn-helix domain-containing protein n=1 Tax=Nocardia bovistercoris TaxID=2785916 RepID=A0A931IFX5_9NOCA|nr:helix-turn-helix domain-containing protein [Nocardia bovistercoris]MBH0779686.1 helix-turn-helix domain-containing protein [Nocardia bovistercoris]